jgi:hypothetical protein
MKERNDAKKCKWKKNSFRLVSFLQCSFYKKDLNTCLYVHCWLAEFEGSTNLKIVTWKLYQQENQIKVLVHTQYFAVIKKALSAYIAVWQNMRAQTFYYYLKLVFKCRQGSLFSHEKKWLYPIRDWNYWIEVLTSTV